MSRCRSTEAAAVPLGGLNALHFMRLAGIQPGEKALINGAGGSIGAYAELALSTSHPFLKLMATPGK